MDEPPISIDPTSNSSRIVPTFKGYSPSGNVTGEVVYANYGTLEDFAPLEVINTFFEHFFVEKSALWKKKSHTECLLST